MLLPSAENWSVECEPAGQCGYFFYHEDARELSFYWEYGAGDVVVIVRADDPTRLTTRHPWIIGREREILQRVADEVVRRRAPTCTAEIDEKTFSIYVREQK
jgi:hypothetical protein